MSDHMKTPRTPQTTAAPSRRTFIKTTTATAAGACSPACPTGWNGGVYADDSPEVKAMRFGMIALTDCSPIVMAHELGYFKFGIDSTVSKEARGR